jgi:hypothetical protein
MAPSLRSPDEQAIFSFMSNAIERDIPEPFVTTRIVDSENEVEIETPVHLSVDENEIFDPGGDHETLFQYEDVENSPGYLGVDPLYMEYAAADQELEDMLDKDYIPRQRLPYFLRFLYPSSMVAVAVKQVEFAVDENKIFDPGEEKNKPAALNKYFKKKTADCRA